MSLSSDEKLLAYSNETSQIVMYYDLQLDLGAKTEKEVEPVNIIEIADNAINIDFYCENGKIVA